MRKGLLKWLREHYAKIISSIAFFPAIIAVGFLLLSWLMLKLDFSEQGKQFKQQLSWLSLKDASTARSILTTIAGGVISLTVFSFSMVMIVLNQAASQMSNRILNSMIENRFQQIVLGFYIGTIVYALFLLSTIRDISSGVYVPAISIYLLIGLTVVDIFFFIYFLDYVTQTVKYETVIKRVQTQALEAMKKLFCPVSATEEAIGDEPFVLFKTPESGYFQSFDQQKLIQMATDAGVKLTFLYTTGTYLAKGTAMIKVSGTIENTRDFEKELFLHIDFYNGEPISQNPEYGFRQLAEVAIKALSPGINDPATAVLSINALTDLFAHRLDNCQRSAFENTRGEVCVVLKVSTFKQLFQDCIFPIWQYGEKDRYIRQALLHMLDQLTALDEQNSQASLFEGLRDRIMKSIKQDDSQ